MNTKKEIVKLVHEQLDQIYSTCKTITKDWEGGGISLAILHQMIKQSKLSTNVVLDPEFVKNYNAMLDQLFKTCYAQATRDNYISYSRLQDNIKVMKESFSEGSK